MELLGNKVKVRELARNLDIPIVPGSPGAVDVETARQVAIDMGLPVMLKAEGGGGGRGIYEVHDLDQLETAFSKASALAHASFGNPRLFVEKLLTSVRHIEIQVIADRYGNVFAFDERDCTIQRNHQKLVEITPSPWPKMTESLRNSLKNYAKKLIKAVGYYSLATVEFLVDDDTNVYLIEVNTRLQVEHPVTEMVTGVDIVKEQLRIAAGEKLSYRQEDIQIRGHAIECRINAEDPRNFMPSPGAVTMYHPPGGPGIRVDSHLYSGYTVPPHYDSLIGKIIAHGETREAAIARMQTALTELVIEGIKSNASLHQDILKDAHFRAGGTNIHYLERMLGL